MDIVTLGLLVCDLIVKPVTPELFQRDSTPVDLNCLPGGDACNVAVNAAALGMKTAVVSAVGNDANGSFIRTYLEDHGVDTRYLKTSQRFGTGTSIVMTQPDGERHFLTSTDIFEDVLPEQVTPELLDGAKILSLNSYYRLAALDDGGVIPAFELAHKMGVLTAMDTAWNRRGRWLERIAPVLPHTDIFLPSFQEAAEITGKTDVREMKEIMRPFGMKIFGVKLGSKGSYVTDFKDEFFIKPFHVDEVVSTVGAGDSYMAGFLTAQVMGKDLYESAVFATAAAAFTVRCVGAVGGMPTAEAVDRFVEENRHQLAE